MTDRRHIHFLQDKDFVAWRLTGDPRLNLYWKEYITGHPEQKEAFEKAILVFSKIQLNHENIPLAEEDQLLHRIHFSIRKTSRKKTSLRFIRYAAAVCILIMSGLFLYQRTVTGPSLTPVLSGTTAEENLNKEDIHLITDSKITSFSKDVQVKFNKSGSVTAQESGSGKPTVFETGKTVMNKLVVPYGKRSELILSDGSKVWVNSGSVLEFPSTFNGDTRSIRLTGEMFIDVAKDHAKPFFVNTPGFRVKVYGTQFNISAYHDDSSQSVVLVTGSVGIKSENDEETYLQPNEMLVYKDRKVEKKQVDATRYICWKDGYILMDQSSVYDVLKHIERYYNQTFEFSGNMDAATRTCTGKFYLSDNFDNVMEAVSILFSIKYRNDGKKTYIDINPKK